ncbi:hypothetical protein A2U01_0042419, partial [Trifolium medium]|nr:hypothetical protein [Trifolium medium]
DDDEGVDNPDEREDFAPEVPAPPEIKQGIRTRYHVIFARGLCFGLRSLLHLL